ncbi:MAG: ImmA/IrrE family metallo-endopeptidase [Candidatus Methanofishera endochildressiae]|uniref:ImmA/IrrE family metallo-endopeptidase n=1 Tax=Candidatus Methanofishera endochildressiae TaxID=2738884 RepID=A0A7Z0SD72_9GAMM|nr:ImmA/IrrE family metallo-endopeptidase [Candidatus Methanofishera endochildressiae]
MLIAYPLEIQKSQLIEYGSAKAGFVQKVLEVGRQSSDAKQQPEYRIRLNEKDNPNVQFATLIHELAHLYLGHLGGDKYLKIKDRSRTVHSERELEAESVSYIVCCRNGVKSKAESYLADYVEQNTTVDSIDLYTLLKVAGQIETLLGLAEHTKFK